ncbi:hypothetical protein AAG570_007261 [Ranatra chinensis]|uniref:Intraflagellar transport protein 52 n=1 Tax=Ranatra chinensis TaxID=642074 RepID=A0ABD0XX89_9HEMI
MLGEGGERSFSTNINYLIEEYGIMVNNDAVVRTHYYKYFHPKECLVSNGVVHGCVPARLGLKNYDSLNQCLSFVYPFGATLNTAKPAVAVLSTGSVSLPLARPVCAFATAKNGEPFPSAGRIAVIGSGHVFTDHYIDKEDNLSVANLVFDFLTAEDFVLDPVDAKEIEVKYSKGGVADTAGFAERLRCCLLETTEELPTDTGVLFNSPLYSLDLGDIVPDIVRAYDILNLKHEPLGLIPPEFNIPLPRLKMAVYPPVFRDPADPPLELFDLEEEFSDDQNQLAEAANRSLTTVGKTTETVAQVEEFIDTCASILGLAGASTPGEGRKNPFDVLYEVAAEISEFKKNLNKHE